MSNLNNTGWMDGWMNSTKVLKVMRKVRQLAGSINLFTGCTDAFRHGIWPTTEHAHFADLRQKKTSRVNILRQLVGFIFIRYVHSYAFVGQIEGRMPCRAFRNDWQLSN